MELNVERYGGMICAPWFDRPLSVAGRAVVKSGDTLKTCLVNIDRDLLMMPSLAIHMNPKVNSGYEYHPQKDLIPLLGDERSQGQFPRLIAISWVLSRKISWERICSCTAALPAPSGAPMRSTCPPPGWMTCSAPSPS